MKNIVVNIKKGPVRVPRSIETLFGQVFSFSDQLVKWWPSLKKLEITNKPDEDFKAFDWVYRLLMQKFEGSGKVIELKRPDSSGSAKIVIQNEGDFESTVCWEFESVGSEKTCLTLHAKVELSSSFVRRFAQKFGLIENELNKDADSLLENIKKG